MAAFGFIATFRQGGSNIRITHAVLAQILFQAGIAKTACPGDDALRRIARIGKQALTLQGVEYGVEFILGLGLNEGAYLAEIVRGGLLSVDKGQWEAANALGMKRSTTLRRIVIPQAMRVIVPPTGNETISMLKTTSLVIAVPFSMELNFVTNAIGNSNFLPIPLLLVAAIYYLLITSILMAGQTRLEAYYGRGFDGERPTKAARGMSRKQQSILAAGTVKDDPTLEVTP